MLDHELCKEILGLDDSWSVSSIEIDEPSRRLDITIRYGAPKKKSLFRRSDDDDAPQSTITYRHLPIAGYRTYLHVPKPETTESNKVWAPAGSQYTKEMEAYIVKALNSCRSVSIAAKLIGISPAEAREISERTGAGEDYEAAPAPISAATPLPEAAAEPVPAAAGGPRSFDLETSDLPRETHPNWQRLISGEIPVQSNVVALQMLLQRVRQQIDTDPTETTRLSAARLLRQYFIKNQNQHPTEIAVLKGEEMVPEATMATTEFAAGVVPPESDACWQKILDGDLKIDTREVGLQMMLERVRLSVERNPSKATRIAGIRILRQFFNKHQNRLQHELRQLGVAPQAVAAAPAAKPVGLAVPAEDHPTWSKLITGHVSLDTSTVALQMMLERVRLSVERNPSEASKLAGIRILRQFFLKHQNRLSNEIAQLNGTAVLQQAPTAGTGDVGVPAESDRVWQTLIDGQLAMTTDNVALQMMLERVRLSVERNPSAANITAGIKLLRQFFMKHRARLQAELRQLGGAPTASTMAPTAEASPRHAGVPPESHPSWQRLINGELELKTDVVALKMMLERIRISINNNPTDASRLAGAKILRQYFLKHQNRHQAELDQLMAA
ncbi:MAG TPA: hypothetical protein VIV20_08935 [Gammaproteobacteria bacterium]